MTAAAALVSPDAPRLRGILSRADWLGCWGPRVYRAAAQLDRYHQIQTAAEPPPSQMRREDARAAVARADHARQREAARSALLQELDEDCQARADRRAAELELAQYVEGVGDTLGRFDLHEIGGSMRRCRQSGCVGLKPKGGHVVAWDHKCGHVRLCPDESREETQRLASRYVPALLEWAGADPRRRLFYAVLTLPNFEEGDLARGKRCAFDWLKSRILDARDRYCLVRSDRGRLVRDGRRTVHARFPSIRGAVVVQEDPLAAPRDDAEGRSAYSWNVHLNVLLCVEGPLDFRALRESWGMQLDIRELPKEQSALRGACLELVKYSARAVPTKSSEKSDKHATAAPPMVQWPASLWAEWWAAQQRFRRTRSYGCMFRVGDPERERLDLEAVEWVGVVHFDAPSGRYWVDLIQGDNFPNSDAAGRRRSPGRPTDDGRPPP